MELIEPFGIPDTYINGVGLVETMPDGNLRITCYTEQSFGGRHEYVVTAKIIIAVRAVPGAVMTVVRGAGMPCRCQAMRLH